jgi:hypothetical protein
LVKGRREAGALGDQGRAATEEATSAVVARSSGPAAAAEEEVIGSIMMGVFFVEKSDGSDEGLGVI